MRTFFDTLYSAYMKFVLTLAANTGEAQRRLLLIVTFSELGPHGSLAD
jgi:hypothetical protein